MGVHLCPVCGTPVSNERTEILGIENCVRCTTQRPNPKGLMSYDEKAGGILQIVEDDRIFRFLKKPINQQR